MAVEEDSTLIVRHLPSELTSSEQEDLLKHFGASSVRTMGNKGRMKHIAFANFPDKDMASAALGKLHQLEILGTRLVVEFSNSHMKKFHPMKSDEYPEVKTSASNTADKEKTKKPVVRQDEIDMKKISENVNSLSREWGIQYPMDSRLEYVYPVATVSILTNIANTLASVPRFYVQVLHLMNKMNLPAPFGPITQTPVLPEGESVSTTPGQPMLTTLGKENSINIVSSTSATNPTPGQSSEESELESDGETQPPDIQSRLPLKRPRQTEQKPRKKQKLVQVIPQITKAKGSAAKASDVFEQADGVGPKKIAFHLPRLEKGTSGASSIIPQKDVNETETLAQVNPSVSKPISTDLTHDLQRLPTEAEPIGITTAELHGHERAKADQSTQDVIEMDKTKEMNGVRNAPEPPLPPPLPVVVEGGFGIMEPLSKESETDNSSDEEEEWGDSKFISSSELRKGRISSSEMRSQSVFKKYDAGEPSTRLYVKNIAKPVTEKDLHHIFGRYVDWDKEEHRNMFDIRLMKEGRMKGQAFITLPTIKLAKNACKDTNGYNLQSKPIVVQFARSAKAKPDDQTVKKDR